ncbi:unnamed protein product [Plutella xylostella]|uniref:(diamondback moth) hypothetical protein n=1 Tax=Plutella xylostella TaxID=51655 RepID=A0A8S4FLG6_PLUXY|nr:unnamed protein product [Plutella xylostella]
MFSDMDWGSNGMLTVTIGDENLGPVHNSCDITIFTITIRVRDIIERERRALAVRCNMLARRFARCSAEAKRTLFRAYCQSSTHAGLCQLHAGVYSALPRTVQQCVQGGDAAATALQCFRSHPWQCNSILRTLADRWDSPLLGRWVRLHAKTLSCDHTKVTPYFIESINSREGFWAGPCPSLFSYLIGWCEPKDTEYVMMGEHVTPKARGIYYVTTNAKPPYARGFPGKSRRLRSISPDSYS